MKKIAILLVTVLLVICNVCIAEDTKDESVVVSVVNMQYVVHFDTYDREGLYTGAVTDGIPNGFGVFVAHNSAGIEWHYIGKWENGQFSGEGAQYWESGQVHKGEYKNNKVKIGFSKSVSTLQTRWMEEYDDEGNQHFITYFPNSEAKYCEGYANTTEQEVVSVKWFNNVGNEIDLPNPLTIIAISYLD